MKSGPTDSSSVAVLPPMRHWPTASLILVALGAIGLPALSAELSREEERQVRRQLASFRQARGKVERQVQVFLELRSIGPAAVERLETLLLEQIESAGAQAVELYKPLPVDAEIAKLRKVMADLRAEPGLTEEKIRKVGDPVVAALQKLMAIKFRTEQDRFQEAQRLRGGVEAIAAFLQSLQDTPHDGFDAQKLQDKIAELNRSLEQPNEFAAAAEVARENALVLKNLPPQTALGVAKLNELRVTLGLPALRVDEKLCKAALGHSSDMARLNFFSHDSPVQGKKSFADRARAAGTTASGENIYQGSSSSRSALLGWFHSPGHHKNMFGNHARQGLGHAAGYWTQLFGR